MQLVELEKKEKSPPRKSRHPEHREEDETSFLNYLLIGCGGPRTHWIITTPTCRPVLARCRCAPRSPAGSAHCKWW